jgi:excisionase family DNA binding protein
VNDDMAKDNVEIQPRFLTPRDVATLLNVSESQVYALMRSGDLPAIKIGGRGVWRWDASSSRNTSSACMRRPLHGLGRTL